jgi:hypothetical protein
MALGEREKDLKKLAPRESAPDVLPREDVRVGGSLTRCPYCHDDVAVESKGWVACRRCLARHHEDCWKESLACGTCGHAICMDGAAEFVAVEQPVQHVAHERRWVRRAWWTLSCLMPLGIIPVVVITRESGDWTLPIIWLGSVVVWFGYGLGWFNRGRVRKVVKRDVKE